MSTSTTKSSTETIDTGALSGGMATFTSDGSSSMPVSSPMQSRSIGVAAGDARPKIPNDLVPQAAKTIVLQKINADGTEGDAVRVFKQFLISANITLPRESDEVETGDGANIDITLTEKYSLEAVVNAYSVEFHSTVSGRDVAYGEKVVSHMDEIIITENAGAYTYIFAADKKPVEKTTGMKDYDIRLFDNMGYTLVEVPSTTAVADLKPGQFMYDETTGTISVSADYKDQGLDIIYNMSKTDVFSSMAKDTISTPIFKIMIYSDYQSVNFKTTWRRVQTISRGSISGDLTEPQVQKAPNTNMSYTFESQAPAIGEKAYSEDIFQTG